MNSYLRIDFEVKYPNNHKTHWLLGHYFFMKSHRLHELEKKVQFIIECVKLNGGQCWFASETIIIPPLEDKFMIGNSLIEESHSLIAETVFNHSTDKELLDKAEELWKTINNQTQTKQ